MTRFGELAKLVDTNRRVLDLYDSYIMGKRDLHKEAETLAYILKRNAPEGGSPGRDRRGTWSASSSGRCLREQQFTYLGFQSTPVDADKQNIFANGDWLHLRYQVAGLVGGWLTDVEVPVTWAGNVRGTMDGVLSWGEVLELKSINDRGYKGVVEYGPKEEHKLQATAYMICTEMTTTRFIYENKNTNQNVEFAFGITAEYEDRVLGDWARLNSLTRSKELEPMLHDCLNGRGPFRWCGFARICEQASYPKVRLIK